MLYKVVRALVPSSPRRPHYGLRPAHSGHEGLYKLSPGGQIGALVRRPNGDGRRGGASASVSVFKREGTSGENARRTASEDRNPGAVRRSRCSQEREGPTIAHLGSSVHAPSLDDAAAEL
jgi:hypothetical protein